MWDQDAADADFAEADAPNSPEALEEAAATIKEEYEAKVRADVEAQVEALAGVDEVCAERGITMPFAAPSEGPI